MLMAVFIGEVRRALGYPSEQELGDDQILMEAWGVTAFYRTKLRLTHESWSVKRWPMPVNAGLPAETNITLGDFAEVVMIKTYDPNNPYHIPRMIDAVRVDQMTSYWSGPDNLPIGGGWAHPHVAACFAPINEDGQWKMLWTPAHSQSCVYMVTYSTGSASVPPIFDDTSLFPIEEQHFFLIADCALNLFAFLADPDKGLNERQKLLAQAQEKKVQQWAPLFEEARWSGFRRETPQRRKIFGESRAGRIGRGWPGGY